MLLRFMLAAIDKPHRAARPHIAQLSRKKYLFSGAGTIRAILGRMKDRSMRNIFYIVLVVGALWLWQEGKLPGFGSAGAYDEQGNPVVLAFTFEGCGQHCAAGLSELKRRGVPFNELKVDLNNSDEENHKLWVKYGKTSFPLIAAGEQKVVGSSKAQLATLLAENFGEEYLTRTEQRYYKKHFHDDGSPKIVMYGTAWCPSCKKLRQEFKDNGVDYVDVDVEQSGDFDVMIKTLEIGGYPATWVGYTRINATTLSAIKKQTDVI